MSFDFATYATPSSTAAQALKAEADSKTGGLKALSTDRSDLFRLNPYNITVKDGWNSRDMRDPDNQAHVDELARSITAIGVQEPLTVYMDGGKPVLTDGHSSNRDLRGRNPLHPCQDRAEGQRRKGPPAFADY